jgi:hypothetical protein
MPRELERLPTAASFTASRAPVGEPSSFSITAATKTTLASLLMIFGDLLSRLQNGFLRTTMALKASIIA